jgi:uncharacterized membrane protein
MRLSRPALALSLLILGAWMGYLALVYDALPAQVASHFALDGRPDGYQSRGFFAAFTIGVLLIMAAQFAALPRLIRQYPSLLNIPQRERLLAPERRERTLAKVSSYLDWFGAATLAMAGGLFVLITRVNLGRGSMGPSGLVLLVAYLAFTLAWMLTLFRDVRR